jgi:BlaI family transcriptional regulator, penicillinase repressor
MERKKQTQRLTKVEEDIMQIIWKLDRCLVKDIIETIGGDDIPHSTVASVVRILEKKGFVGHKAYGRTHEYFPIIRKEDYAKQGLSAMMEKYFGGSPKALVSFLVQEDKLGLDELKELYRKLDSSSKK